MRQAIRQLLAAVFVAAVIGCDRSAAPLGQPPPSPSTIPAPASRPAATNWSQYAASDALQFFTARHFNASRSAELGDPLVLITWFRGENAALEYAVGTNGKKWDRRVIYNWAYQDSHTEQLDGVRLNVLADALRALPPSSLTPPLARLVMVSHSVDGVWRTDAYDASELPLALEKVFSIIGERFETRDRVRKNPA
jgi:hypothetical protein